MRTNNFDLIRFVLASIVVFFHACVLSQSEPLSFLLRFISSSMAVKGFFVVSGYLIFRSWEGSRDALDYSTKRVRRIYPGYAAVVLGAALIGAAATPLPLQECFSAAWCKYVIANLLFMNFLEPNLPGLFTGNPVAAVNGALWTLKIEVMFYAVVPALAWVMRRCGPVRGGLIIYASAVVYTPWMLHLAGTTGNDLFRILSYQLPGQLSFFIVGAVLYYKEESVRRWLLPGAVIAIPALAVGGPVFTLLFEPLLLGVIVIYFAIAFPHLGNFGRFGDFSYGIYIIHFPVLQWLVWKGYFVQAPFASLLLGWGVILIAAFLSWHLVERPFLLRSSHYVKATITPPSR